MGAIQTVRHVFCEGLASRERESTLGGRGRLCGTSQKTSETTTSVAEAVPAHVTKRRELHHFASTPRMRSMNKSRSERLRKARTPSSCDSFRQCAADRECHLTFFRKLIQNSVSRWHAKGKPSCGINRTIVRRMCCHEKLCGRVRSEVCRSLSQVG